MTEHAPRNEAESGVSDGQTAIPVQQVSSIIEEGKAVNNTKGVILGCVLGISSQPYTDWNRWPLPILLEYCPAKEPLADRFERTEEMVRLEAAGFVPLGLVASNLDGHAGLGLVIVGETPSTIRQYLLQQEPEIINKALEHENRRGAT